MFFFTWYSDKWLNIEERRSLGEAVKPQPIATSMTSESEMDTLNPNEIRENPRELVTGRKRSMKTNKIVTFLQNVGGVNSFKLISIIRDYQFIIIIFEDLNIWIFSLVRTCWWTNLIKTCLFLAFPSSTRSCASERSHFSVTVTKFPIYYFIN